MCAVSLKIVLELSLKKPLNPPHFRAFLFIVFVVVVVVVVVVFVFSVNKVRVI